tara:strand:- start:9 stop:509 length:501 start_codon:yes stop_codon:yes gene_type:complete
MLLLVLLIVWIASAFFCASVANAKGYSYTSWFIAGFFFGFIALISVAGLPDKKLRNYILQIGLKQDAIQEENLVEDDNSSIFENRKFRFTTKSTANNEEVFKELLSTIKKLGYQKQFDEFGIKSSQIDKGFFGSKELNCRDEDDLFVLTIKGKEINDQEIQWTGDL